MTYLVIATIVIIAYFVYRFLIRPMWMTNRMRKGIRMVYMGLARRELLRLQPTHGDEGAAKLAAAIANEVFSATPSTAEAKRFLSENRDMIRRHAKALQEDAELCMLLSAAMLMKGMQDWARGRKDANHAFDALDNLKSLGLYLDSAAGEGTKHYNVFYYRAADYLGRTTDPTGTSDF